jgi:ubiquinone/menaquinone biosynthesis C-methylase UbiE
MATPADFRQRTRAVWASGDWDTHSRLIAPVGAVVIDRLDLRPGLDLLDVGTGTGGNVAIPAALRGAKVVGLDLAPELFEHARRRAAEAGVDIEWVEGDAQDLPFADESFDRVVSTFGAMFAPDHERAAGELVRVCRSGGRVAMTTWLNEGYAAALFKLSGAFLPPPPAGVQPPPLWGVESHVEEVFAAAGVTPRIAHETFDVQFESVTAAVEEYTTTFGPYVTARTVLEPQGRWPEFVEGLTELVRRFNVAEDGAVRIPADYLLITVDR